MSESGIGGESEAVPERYYRSLYHFALSLTRSESMAADLTQETFYLWAAKGHQLRDLTKIKAWLFTTLHREFLKRQRHETRFPHVDAAEVEQELPVIPATVIDHMDAQTVMQALQSVDLVHRTPLAMFYLEDFSYKEIADALEVPIGTVMSRLARGKSQLRMILAGSSTHADGDGKVVPLSASTRQHDWKEGEGR